MTNPLPEYFRLLAEAQQAAQEVDDYDLRTDDASSLGRFQGLQAEQAASSAGLVNFVRRNGEEIVRRLQAPVSS